MTYTAPQSSNNLLQNDLDKEDYQVISKPSIMNKAEANEDNSR